MSQKSKINLSYDPTEYYIISMAYSIGQLMYFVSMLELHSYFTLQSAETADTVYDSSISLCVAHKWWGKLGNFYFPFLSENLCYRKRLYICLVNHNYFVSCFRLERQNTNYAYSKYPKSPLFPEKSWHWVISLLILNENENWKYLQIVTLEFAYLHTMQRNYQ